jgi:integrase/recombinase XerC
VNELDSVAVENTFEAVRDRLIIEMLYATGIRLSEMLSLQHQNVDLYNQQIKVLGKRNKERVVPVATPFTQQLKDYFDKKKETGLPLDGCVFVRSTGEPMYSKQVYTIVKRFLAGVTTLQRKSPHVLRHTFATHMLNNGADLNAIKELLGHSSLASTQVYTHNSIEKLKSTYKQAHPKA